MALRKIRTQGDKVLNKPCKPVTEMTSRTEDLIDDMIETMYDADGVGLAAPQVTYVVQMLRDMGWPIDGHVTTIAQAKEAILKALPGSM